MRPSMYTRPDKPKYIAVPGRMSAPDVTAPVVHEPVIVDSSTECHVTPEHVALDMVDYLEPFGSDMVLEPSCGTGSLIKALLSIGQKPETILGVERHYKLADICSKLLGHDVIQADFLEWETKQRFFYIIMNPPFKKVKAHMNKALSLLEEKSSTLVALVPITYQHPDMEVLEILTNDTFALAKVNTKLIIYRR